MYEFRLPEDFLIGTANSAFQSEGAWQRDGKSPSMMEHFSLTYAGKMIPGTKNNKKPLFVSHDTPENGCFFYDNYEAYIEDMAKTGQNTFRMSLAWPRIIPTGYGEVNQSAIDFYNKVINKLLEHNITPFVDLCHWDVPQCLYDEGGGFAHPKFAEYFEAYARVCFAAFGDRVKLWSTFNEICVSVGSGYINGTFPPYEQNWARGLQAIQNTTIAHFRAVRAYREMGFDGQIGQVMVIVPIAPAEPNEQDAEAAARMAMSKFDLYMQPLVEASYPKELMELPIFKENMPENYQQELEKWFVPMDFVGLNYYHFDRSAYNPDTPLQASMVQNFYALPGQKHSAYPAGLFDVVWYAWNRFKLPVYITENGLGFIDSGDEETDCNDDNRVTYLREHLRMVVRCLRMGLPLKGYYCWNDADSFEQQSGFSHRYGLTWVDRQTGRRRWKKSRYYFSQICKARMIN